MYIDKTNEVMMNYYKKQEILKAKTGSRKDANCSSLATSR